MKRVFDFFFALTGIILLIPLFVLISIIIKLNNPGPILYKQKRIGKDRKPFILIKFRSMITLDFSNKDIFEAGNNSRVTSIGRILRKTKLDELPQLYNVLKGDMSLVGPRPEVEKWIAIYPEKWERILSIRPGITDNASIVFKNEELILSESVDPEKTYREIILPQKLEMYEQYVENNSFSKDLKLIFKTIFAIL